MKTKLLLAFIGLLIILNTKAQNNFKLKRVTLFKDGTSFIEKELNTSTQNKTVFFEELPVSYGESDDNKRSDYNPEDERIILGTLRFSAVNNEILESIVNRNTKDSSVTQDEYESFTELLNLNRGKKIKINDTRENKQITATIDKLVSSTLVVIMDNKYLLIPVQYIGNIEFVDNPLTKKRVVEFKEKPAYSLELKLMKDSKEQQIDLSYLQKGISWLPTYFIDISGQKKGKLLLEANLMNDIEDIKNADINFAVGVPSFSFGSVHEPLVSENNVWKILRELNAQQLLEFSEGIQMNMMTQQRSRGNDEQDGDYTPNAEGKGGEDLYFYKKQNISLNKNGRLKTQLLTMDFDFEDVYSCELDKNMDYNNYDKKSKINPVWHSIRFKNSSNQPLTTGTVFFRKEEKGQLALISQNQLDYTPINEYVTAKIAVAPDIMVSSKDVETDRKPFESDYMVNIDGEISIVNYKAFPVDMILNRKIVGTMLNSDLAWKVTSNLETYNIRNTSNQVSWKIRVEAGKTIQIKYKYKIIVD